MADDRDFQETIRLMADKQRHTDHTDQQNEAAGRETGQMQRFFPRKTNQSIQDKNSRDKTLSALQLILLNDPVYAALYNETNDLLNRAEIATEKALQQAEQDLEQSEDTLNDTLNNANKLADGTAVFKDSNGNVWTKNGRHVEGDERKQIVWKKGALSQEDYLQQKQTADDRKQHVETLRHYQVDVLGHARHRMSNQDNLVTKEEIEGIQKEIKDKSPQSVTERIDAEITEAKLVKTASYEIDVLKF
ncbi:MAG: hypothetical protein KAS59_08860 [Alphaproteobacteria bacterium]|nr:hypothetical protein [Alphaproteobacteria bacterium]